MADSLHSKSQTTRNQYSKRIFGTRSVFIPRYNYFPQSSVDSLRNLGDLRILSFDARQLDTIQRKSYRGNRAKRLSTVASSVSECHVLLREPRGRRLG